MIYIVQGISGTPYKIGYSRDEQSLPKRICNLQVGYPWPLEVKFRSDGTTADEERAHRALADFRLCGEWFEAAMPVGRFVDTCNSHGLMYALQEAEASLRLDGDEHALSQAFVSESAAHSLLHIRWDAVRLARAAGTISPLRFKDSAGRERKYYAVADLRTWLRKAGIQYRVSWFMFSNSTTTLEALQSKGWETA